MTTRRLRTAVAGAALLTLANACSRDDSSSPEPPTPSTSSRAPSPSHSEPPTATESASTEPATEPTGSVITPSQLHRLGWRSIQAPSEENVRYVGEDVALGGADRPAGPLMQYDLAPGQLYGDPGAGTSRAEVYGRVAGSWSDPQETWPDPPGSERWYTFSFYVGKDFQPATDQAMWLDLTQWKGRDGGSPPVAVEVTGSELRLGGTRTNAGAIPGEGNLGPLSPGAWTTLTVGIRFSPDDDGWVQVFRDGSEALPRTEVATMDTIDGEVDPVYLKQGIYRSQLWTTAQRVYFTQVAVTDSLPEGLG